MGRLTMSEATARFTFTAACGLSIFAAGAAIVLRLRGIQGPAAIFLVLAFLSCCSFFLNNQLPTSRLLFVAANLLLIPLFLYLVMLRSRASAQFKRRQRKREQKAQQELAALGTVDQILKSNAEQDGTI